MVVCNIANSGKFSTDRAIREYARDIWNVPIPEVAFQTGPCVTFPDALIGQEPALSNPDDRTYYPVTSNFRTYVLSSRAMRRVN